jgi:hypothetical protein
MTQKLLRNPRKWMLLLSLILVLGISGIANSGGYISAEEGSTILTFQRGVDGYTGIKDTYLQQDRATTDHGDFDELGWDLGTGRDQITLIRFDDIFGLLPNQIPEGAVISSATLTYSDFNDGQDANVNESLIDWLESVTYYGFGVDPGVQPEEVGAFVGNASGVVHGFLDLDVTASLAAWSADPSANHG